MFFIELLLLFFFFVSALVYLKRYFSLFILYGIQIEDIYCIRFCRYEINKWDAAAIWETEFFGFYVLRMRKNRSRERERKKKKGKNCKKITFVAGRDPFYVTACFSCEIITVKRGKKERERNKKKINHINALHRIKQVCDCVILKLRLYGYTEYNFSFSFI